MTICSNSGSDAVNASLTFLGTGTSTGIPVLGCDCATCRSSDPRDRRLRCSALFTTAAGRHILIDCGPDVRQQLLAHHNAPVDGLIITHSHYDHVGGVDDLRTLSYATPVSIYCRADVAADLRRIMPYCFGNNDYPNIPRLVLNEVEEFKPFEVAGVTVEPLAVEHGRIHILGFRIGRMAYITDATSVPARTIERIKGVDVLVVNALRHTPNPTHMNLAEALDVIKAVAPREAYLIHMSHGMGRHAEASASLPPGVRFAYDGLTVEIPA